VITSADDDAELFPQRSADPLGLDVEQMRRLAHSVTDRVVDHWLELRSGPAIAERKSADLMSELGGPIPELPGDVAAAIEVLISSALPSMQHVGHPRYFARVPGPASFAAILGDWLSTGFNAMASSWTGGSGPTTVELVVVDWLRELVGLPPGAEGILGSGGSAGNATALAVARAAGHDGIVYVSDQTHASIRRGLLSMGWIDGAIHVVPTTSDWRWSTAAVAAAIASDRRRGLSPGIVVATAGTTNTGAVDPLNELADLCATEHLWLHVDGAYGAPAVLSARGKVSLAGIERADSVAFDPHKWLFQPYDVGCVLVRQPGLLEACFTMNPEYLRDVTAGSGEVDLRNRSLELSRRSRALKIWLTFHAYGRQGLARAVDRSISLAERTQTILGEDPEWEVITPAQLGVITFARSNLAAAGHIARAKALTASGYAAISTTELGGRTVFRLCLINPGTTEDDVRGTLKRLASDHWQRAETTPETAE
jgi:aromatic-L-amino-acid decarboxylase